MNTTPPKPAGLPDLPADAAARIAHLFRDALAGGRAHELLPLLQRYRAGERG